MEEGDNFFMAKPFSFIHQTVYFSMYLSISIAVLLYKKLFINKIQYGILIFLGIGVLQTLNKAGIIILFLILGIKFYSLLKKKIYAVLVFFLFFCFGALVFISNPRLRAFNANFTIDKSQIKVKDFKVMPNSNPSKTNTRILLWASAIDLISERPIFGIGAGGSNQKLSEVYAVKAQWYDKRHRFNVHNQYLQISLDIGIVGLIVFILLFVFLGKAIFYANSKGDKMLILNFMLLVGMNFLFESVFERYSGISFFCLFYCLMVYLPLENNDKYGLSLNTFFKN